MVADDAAARAVWLGEQGALAGAARGTVLVECSTVTVEWIDELARAAAAAGCALLDAPVTGSRTHAASGELSFLVGGPLAALETARPVLAAMSRASCTWAPPAKGPCSSSSTTSSAAFRPHRSRRRSRSSRGAASTGPRPSRSLTNGAPGSPLVKALAARMTARDYTPNFLLTLRPRT
jgi:3-hydroxyisobutyrate dehydrogenase